MQLVLLRNLQLGEVRRDLALSARIEAGASSGALAVDLDGYRAWPGLVNAHDHLELNHYPRSKFQAAYPNAHAWGEAMNARLDESPYREGRAVPLADRLFLGGLKNLLCGALTVAHHNPLHRPLRRADFPVRVVARYGWAHSLHFTPDVAASLRATPSGAPWIIHLAEGTDAVAAAEYGQLAALGCAGPQTVLVHGVGLSATDLMDAARQVRGLVWCPSSNVYLLGRTADVRAWRDVGGRLALGNNSRLTADGDLLDELRAAQASGPLAGPELLELVTTEAAALLGLDGAGRLDVGCPADLILTRPDRPLVGARRSDLALVVRGGVPLIGDPDVMACFPVQTAPARLDGVSKLIQSGLARRILRCSLTEPGLEVESLPVRRWQLRFGNGGRAG